MHRTPNPLAQHSQLAGAGLSSVGSLASALVGAPWQAVVLTVLAGLAVVALQSVLHTVMPQESADRLIWWVDRRIHHTRRQMQSFVTRLRRPG
ncbi:hypothetical protein [Streptomyces alanosinicus]|uniref:Uncharacterized protein n=1 Tax=Streptomyces alanosinicus TaxID=68171 RepID=A0A919D7U0_9ACTN|nr:hypothetical protein [Streptomyces alanosinicus]GHE15269.1 hypothetical protein GCM10010339_89390 [Streptomyces alanosinicus]